MDWRSFFQGPTVFPQDPQAVAIPTNNPLVQFTNADIDRGIGLATGFAGGGLTTAPEAGGLMDFYKRALRQGRITPSEYQGFIDALPRAQPPGFPDKPAARAELNRSSRAIDNYYAKDAASRDGGPKLTDAERADWQDAFRRKQAAQQYLESTQPLDLTGN